MDERTHEDIRKLLRSFGVRADEAIRERFERGDQNKTVRLRVLLEEVPEAAPPRRLLELEGEVRG